MNRGRMPKKNIAILFIVISLIAILAGVGLSSHKKSNLLQATESLERVVEIKVDGQEVTEQAVKVTGNQTEIELVAKVDTWLKLPVTAGFYVTRHLANGQESNLPELSEDDVDMEAELAQMAVSETSSTVEDGLSEATVFQLTDSTSSAVYMRLVAEVPLHLTINRKSRSQSLIRLVPLLAEHEPIEVVELSKSTNFMEETGQLLSEPAEDVAVAETDKEQDHQTEPLNDSRAVSLTSPFNVTVAVSRLTGVAPFDAHDEPGYDSSPTNDRVRSFDSVSYTITAGISINSSEYSNLRVRLDAEVEGAWRLDGAGKIRQVIEIQNGTLSETGNSTKKATHSTWLNVDAASAQVFMTETFNTYGGVGGDELKPAFTITIETATMTTGETVAIDQVIDGSVSPALNDTLYLSAKPYVEVKLTRNTIKNSTFEKTTGTDDKPFSLITPVASYVQLKPLPGRADLTSLKGATYPVGGISYEINQNIIYTNQETNQSQQLIIGSEIDPVEVIIYDGFSGLSMARRVFTKEYSKYSSVYKPLSLQATVAPYGYTRQTYSPNQAYSNLIGVYDTGNPTATNNPVKHTIEIENNDYTPISVGDNKWYFSGGKMPANTEPFSVTAMQVRFPYDYLEKQVGVNSTLTYELSVSSIAYEGIQQPQLAKANILWDRKWPGSITAFAAFLNDEGQPLSSVASHDTWSSNGDGSITVGNQVIARFMTSFTDVEAKTATVYGRWNANSFSYDFLRDPIGANTKIILYGVNSKGIPDVTLRSQEELENAYTWYSLASEAAKSGKISAVKVVGDVTPVDGYFDVGIQVPLIASGSEGGYDALGSPNIGLSNAFTSKTDGSLSRQAPLKNSIDYSETKYLEDGKIVTHNPSNHWGDTLYIRGLQVRPTLTANKTNYNPTEKITWTASGSVTSGSEQNHKVELAVTIPKETSYEYGSAKNRDQESIVDPLIVDNSDGTQTLTFVQDYEIASNYNPMVQFDTSIVASQLVFTANQATLNAKVVSQVSLERDETIFDTSTVAQRTSHASVTVSNAGVIVVDKVTDAPFIETGNGLDPAQPSVTHPTDIRYTISYRNHSPASIDNVRVLDVLPFNGDGRGTKFQGSYHVVEALSETGGGELWYTTAEVPVNQDPNALNLAGTWLKVGSDMAVLASAKAVMAVYPLMKPGELYSYSVTLRPKNQQVGDVFANSPALNSDLNQYVAGVVSTSKVYGRELAGIAWYDDDLDGLIGNKADGSPEDVAANVPVKLYRTSQLASNYRNQLVMENLAGDPLIDGSGNSLVKTDGSGNYLFSQLAEGEYVVEFALQDQLIQKQIKITEALVGADGAKNSKADQTTAKTPAYNEPILSQLPSLLTSGALYQVEHINIGLIRPGGVSLYKYAAGSATDSDGDGKLTDSEKATGTPLAGAEFELFEVENDVKIGSAVTKADGFVNFEGLFPGQYYLVETKSPEGFELVKQPIYFDLSAGNQLLVLYQDDAEATKLPFTGSNQLMVVLLIGALSVLSLGIVVLLVVKRPITPSGKGR